MKSGVLEGEHIDTWIWLWVPVEKFGNHWH
uniref:Uncharacterized protein n=1 Tax=Anguilla anguilla TaxID=7936 RepID=A0A0E9P8G1_ANGAN